MIHILLTYNIDNASKRETFASDFEAVLIGMKLNKEHTNQSTYFGAYRTKEDFVKDLFNAVSKMTWQKGDMVTIYYPMVQTAKPSNLPDIGRHYFKREGDTLLNLNIIKSS
jgi:acyl-coenzyme A synthetase/AMP-(fatty) acid ligase